MINLASRLLIKLMLILAKILLGIAKIIIDDKSYKPATD
jgi:hypothetical protein